MRLFSASAPIRTAATAAAAAAFGLAGGVLAQDAPPDGIGTDLLDIAREAGSVPGTEPPLGAVPHPSGGSEVLPLNEGLAEAEIVPSAPAGPDAAPVLAADPAAPGERIAVSPAPAGDELRQPSVPNTATAAAAAPGRDIAAAERTDPLELLKGLWRTAVASGDTSEGFDAWLSGALRPESEAPGTPASQAALTREVASAWGRRTGPVTLGEAGRVVTTFGESIPTAFCSPLRVCYIELEPGEEPTDTPSLGDSVRWQMEMKVQGRDPETVVFEIKPAADALETNLVIPTDRRLYTITLINDPDVHTPILAFRWPDSEARAIADGIERRKAEELAVEEARAAEAAARADATATELAHSGVPTESGPRGAELLDFRFRVDGKARFRPVRVFADGSRTYIDLHPNYRGPLPAIVAGKGEGNAALNTRVSESGSRLVADRVITDVWLQSGRERIRIRRITN